VAAQAGALLLEALEISGTGAITSKFGNKQTSRCGPPGKIRAVFCKRRRRDILKGGCAYLLGQQPRQACADPCQLVGEAIQRTLQIACGQLAERHVADQYHGRYISIMGKRAAVVLFGSQLRPYLRSPKQWRNKLHFLDHGGRLVFLMVPNFDCVPISGNARAAVSGLGYRAAQWIETLGLRTAAPAGDS